MLKMYPQITKWAFIAAVCASACAITGCLESNFNLADDSRLPRGMAIPLGLARTDVSVTLDYYTMGDAIFIMRDKAGKTLVRMSGKTIGNPRYLKSNSQGPAPHYPAYELVDINGVIEIMEHRRLEPIVYITDDPVTREELLGKRTQ